MDIERLKNAVPLDRKELIPIFQRFTNEYYLLEKMFDQLLASIPSGFKLPPNVEKGYHLRFQVDSDSNEIPDNVLNNGLFMYIITEDKITRKLSGEMNNFSLIDKSNHGIIASIIPTVEDSIDITPEEYKLIMTIMDQYNLHERSLIDGGIFELGSITVNSKILDKLNLLLSDPTILSLMKDDTFILRTRDIPTSMKQIPGWDLHFYPYGCVIGEYAKTKDALATFFHTGGLLERADSIHQELISKIGSLDIDKPLEDMLYDIISKGCLPNADTLNLAFSIVSKNSDGSLFSLVILNNILTLRVSPLEFYCYGCSTSATLGDITLTDVPLYPIPASVVNNYKNEIIKTISSNWYFSITQCIVDLGYANEDKLLGIVIEKLRKSGLKVNEHCCYWDWKNEDMEDLEFIVSIQNPSER